MADNNKNYNQINGAYEFTFDTSSPLIDSQKPEEDEKPPVSTGSAETYNALPEARVYLPHDIQKFLGLGKAVYEYLEQVYKTQTPFRVIKVGKIYRIPKQSFDNWLNGGIN